jgi:hypothetical protein
MNTTSDTSVDAYNNDCLEAQRKSIYDYGSWDHQSPRTTMGDFIQQQKAANDNKRKQLELDV